MGHRASRAAWGTGRFLFLARDKDGGFLHLDDAAAGAFFQLGQELVDFLTGLNELDLDGQMVGDIEDVGGVEAMRRSKAGHSFEDAGTVDAVLEEEIDEAGVDRDSVVFGAVAEVDGDFYGFA
jgi:hypothetical protein